VKQCAVLFVNPERKELTHPSDMRKLGFVVHETRDWPADEVVRQYHVIVVRVSAIGAAPMLAARLRAKRHFGRRLLIALVDAGTLLHERKAAEASGFDDVLNECCDTRQLTTRMLRRIRMRPELRCALPSPVPRRPAA
jgi:hypothetical protein